MYASITHSNLLCITKDKKSYHEKTLYIFSMYGIIFAVSEDGHKKQTSVVFGFKHDRTDSQETSMIKGFIEISREYEAQYKIVRVFEQKKRMNLLKS